MSSTVNTDASRLSLDSKRLSLGNITYQIRPDWTNYVSNHGYDANMCSTCILKKCFKCEHRLSDEERKKYILEKNGKKNDSNSDKTSQLFRAKKISAEVGEASIENQLSKRDIHEPKTNIVEIGQNDDEKKGGCCCCTVL